MLLFIFLLILLFILLLILLLILLFLHSFFPITHPIPGGAPGVTSEGSSGCAGDTTAALAQRLYAWAFTCLSLVVAKTQSEEKFFDMFLFKQKQGESVWNRVVDCSSQYKFYSETDKFETVYLGGLGAGGTYVSHGSDYFSLL